MCIEIHEYYKKYYKKYYIYYTTTHMWEHLKERKVNYIIAVICLAIAAVLIILMYDGTISKYVAFAIAFLIFIGGGNLVSAVNDLFSSKPAIQPFIQPK